MKKIYTVKLISILIAIFNTTLLYSSVYGPGLLFYKPYEAEPYESYFFMSYTGGQTDQGYDKNGIVVPYLNTYGNEAFLRRFIDASLPPDSIESIGVMNFLGTFKFQQVNIIYVKNIHNHLFIGTSTSIRNLNINNITTQIIYTSNDLTPTEFALSENFITSNFPKNINTAGMYTTTIDLGYNRRFTDFKSIDFLQLLIQGSVAMPESMLGENLSFLQFPIAGNLTFTYPVVTILTLGIADHMTLGFFGMITPLQPAQKMWPVNKTESSNQVVLTESILLKINPKPVFSVASFVEFYNFVPQCILTIGGGYSYGMPWSLSTFNQREYPNDIVNINETLNAWSITSAFFALDYDFASPEHPHAPNVSISYVIPISGRYYPKMNAVGGLYNLSFTYEF